MKPEGVTEEDFLRLKRRVQGLSKEELDALSSIIKVYRQEEQGSWRWSDDGVWRRYNKNDDRVVAEVILGTDFNIMPGPHWYWRLPDEENINLYKRVYKDPFGAREAANSALLATAEELLRKAEELKVKAGELEKNADNIKQILNGPAR